MRVLHVTADWKWTGPAEPMLHAVSGLRARGHAVDLACPEAAPGVAGALAERARERGVEPVLALARAQGFRPWRDRAEVARLRALLGREPYDVIHTHHARDQILCALAARGGAARLVASWHGGEPIPRRPWNRLRFGPRGASGVTVLSPAIRAAAAAWLGRDPQRIAVIPGAVDTDRFAPRARDAALAASFGIEPGQRVLGLVARLQPHRRVELILQALRLARRDAPGLRLLVVGRGTRAQSVLEQPVRALGLERAVIRAGYRSGDYAAVLGLCDALVFLVPGSDGSCRAVLEAMALAIPTIASRRGILPETVVEGVTGRVSDEKPEALAALFVDLWKDPAGWQARGRAARQRVLDQHGLAAQAERLERFYAGLGAGSASCRSTSSR